ncbi:MAG: hypothetical protein WAN60_07905 [Candidatus Sulfotelmatobacter sp.]
MSDKKPPTREIAPRDLSPILKDAPAGAWVALSHDKTQIVATGDSIRATADLARSRGEDDPVLFKMPLAAEGVVAGVK